ncbi:MAG: hypothetical protein OXJ53_13010 [Gammaproteobacteria bacterium]|nr:hypothetical protein [Gammaproteobacteria bacterium]MDE0272888.1 hypothetical protein [Gammaproteobacteria bacterium]
MGAPLRLHVAKRAGPRAAKALHRDVVRYVAMGTNIFEAINAEDFGVGASAESYLAHLHSAGARLRDYVAWRNARLLAPGAAGMRGAVHVYTDIMTASLQRRGEAKRFQPLPIAVSAVRLAERRTDYIIAAHPGFMPMKERQVRAMMADLKRRRRAGELRHESPWDCFHHPFRVDVTQSVEERFRNQPEFSRRGQYLVEQYMLLAHFLVLRKMLSRFPLVLHYLDGSKAQMGAALTALADETRAGRWEIAICQSNDFRQDREEREPDADDFGQAGLGKSVDREWERRRRRWSERRVDKAGGLFEAGSEIDAQLHLEALRGGHSTKGGWAWLKHPPPGRRHNGGVSLWLTQRPNSSFAEVGRSLLMESSTLPVDRVHRQLRARVAALRRPGHRAKPGRGYEGARKSPITVLGELWIGLMRQGFVRRTSTRGDRVVRAEAMGIARHGERPNDTAEVAWDFQLDFGHAERISGWIRQ